MSITLGGMGALEEGLPAATVNAIYRRALGWLGTRLVAYAKRVTPVRTGRLRGGWSYSLSGRSVSLKNGVYYANYVNSGHRVVRGGRTVGYVCGRHMREKAEATAMGADYSAAVAMVRRALAAEQKKRIEAMLRQARRAAQNRARDGFKMMPIDYWLRLRDRL